MSHVFSTMSVLAGYLGWAAIGNTMTGRYPFFWMDPSLMGSTGLVAAYAAGFVAMGPASESFACDGLRWDANEPFLAAFAVIYGLTSLRDKLATHASRRQGYSRIPDSGADSGTSSSR